MFRASRSFVSTVLMLMALAIGVVAAVTPQAAYAAPARQPNNVTLKLTAEGIEAPEQIQGGLVTFMIENAGAEPGQSLTIYRLKDENRSIRTASGKPGRHSQQCHSIAASELLRSTAAGELQEGGHE